MPTFIGLNNNKNNKPSEAYFEKSTLFDFLQKLGTLVLAFSLLQSLQSVFRVCESLQVLAYESDCRAL